MSVQTHAIREPPITLEILLDSFFFGNAIPEGAKQQRIVTGAFQKLHLFRDGIAQAKQAKDISIVQNKLEIAPLTHQEPATASYPLPLSSSQ